LQQRDREVVLQLHPVVVKTGTTPELLKNDLARLLQPGIRSSAQIEVLEQMKRPRLRAIEVVPPVFPRKAVDPRVEILRLNAHLDADPLDVVVAVQAVSQAAQVLSPSRRRRRERLVRAERHAPLGVIILDVLLPVDVKRLLRLPGRRQKQRGN
jgi:hypothetical protein